MQNAIITKITISGANEKLNVDEVINFLERNPQVELSIPVSEKLCPTYNAPLVKWIDKLCERISDKFNPALSNRIAFHVCGNWAYTTAKTGLLPAVLAEEILWKVQGGFPRIQLNIGYEKYNINSLDPTPLARLIQNLLLPIADMPIQIILQLNEHTSDFAYHLQSLTKNFCVLYDQSHGKGMVANTYINDFPSLYQGYAGGLCADNIATELAKINNALNKPTEIWVDAEGKLKTDSGNTLDLARAQAFVDATMAANGSELDELITKLEAEADPWAKYELGEN